VLAAPASAADRAEIRAEAERLGFDTAEEARLNASAEGGAASVMALAEFYAAHQLWPETLAALARLKTQDEEAETLGAEAHYRFGRYHRLAALSPTGDSARGYRAMALVRQGSFTDALEAFRKARAPAGFDADYHLSLAEAHIEMGDVDGASAALARAEAFNSAGVDLARRQYLRAALLQREGEDEKARAEFRRAAAATAPDDWSMRARLALAEDEEALGRLSLEWRSDAFDRDLLMRRAASRAAARAVGPALGAYAEVTARFPDSDAALKAQGEAGKLLAALFDDADLSAGEAARLFFDHVAFAPPGKEGDALIRRAAARLKTLGLYAQAAALIDHQVFKRLRGADRSRIAADLAELHLAARKPEAALAALRATRIAGLDAQTNARRRRLEAIALGALGKRDAALSLLEGATQADDLRLRASLAWDSERWPQSAADYAAIFAAAPAAPSREDREAAVRAATAFLLAGDRAAYRAFVVEALPRLEGSREEAMIRSLGDVDRDVFLDRFMQDYRALYGAVEG
jgi:hypothetical protein